MKKFIFNTLKILFITGFIFIGFVSLFADGKTDPYYLNLTSPKTNSMILGSSRAARGLMPSVFNQSLLYHDNRMQNFAFTMIYSSYGPRYLEAVKNKLKKTSKNGIFLLEVNPIVLSTEKDNIHDDIRQFIENDTFMGNLMSYSSRPNLEYIVKYYNEPFIKIFTNKFLNKAITLHEDGWLLVDIPLDQQSVQTRTSERIDFYKRQFAGKKFSPARLRYLKETIEYLNSFGSVYLVRLPIADQIHGLESGFMPDFDQKMDQLSRQYNVQYFNFTDHSGRYKTVDGDHLFAEDAQRVSAEILRKIDQRLTLSK